MISAQPLLAATAKPAPRLRLVPRPSDVTRGHLPAELAHDLRGMLTVIKGHAELLSEDDGYEQHQRSCQTILWSCKMIGDLIENGLELDRTGSRPQVDHYPVGQASPRHLETLLEGPGAPHREAIFL